MKNIIISSILAASLLFTSGCSKEYLNTKPTESIGNVEVFETTENAKLAINGICKLMTKQYVKKQGFNGEGTIKMFYGNYAGNNFVISRSSYRDAINSNYHENTDARNNYYPWFYYYMLIGNANIIICNIDNAAGPLEEQQFIKAQALTFRAYAYTMLSQIYCNRWMDSNNGATNGLALRIDESTGELPLSTLAETYKQIYADLDEAIKLYTESKGARDDDDNYSPDINVAYATYARAALVRQDYTKAAEMAPKAYSGYELMDVKDYKDGFANPTSEWIWSSHGSIEETLHYYSYHAYIGYNASTSAIKSYPPCISKTLYEKIPTTDIRKGMFLDPTGYEYNKTTGKADKGSDLEKLARSLYPDIYETSKIFAYTQYKVKCNDMPGVGHLNHFRSSEMYLIEAEAKYFLNDEVGARAALSTLTKDSGRDTEYSCTKSGQDLLTEIKLYRAIELYAEGFDWFDMKRWGDTLDRLSFKEGGNFQTPYAITITPSERNKWTWKIPAKETDFNDMIN